MRRTIEYQWHTRELMARHGMRNSRDLVEPLRERGITLSESQIYRLVMQEPERISVQVLAALCDIFRVESNELITVTARDAKATRPERLAAGSGMPDFADTYRPTRARVIDDDD